MGSGSWKVACGRSVSLLAEADRALVGGTGVDRSLLQLLDLLGGCSRGPRRAMRLAPSSVASLAAQTS